MLSLCKVACFSSSQLLGLILHENKWYSTENNNPLTLLLYIGNNWVFKDIYKGCNSNTVKSVLRGHLWDKDKVAL